VSVRGTPLEGCCQEGEWYVDFYRGRISDALHRVEINQSVLCAKARGCQCAQGISPLQWLASVDAPPTVRGC